MGHSHSTTSKRGIPADVSRIGDYEVLDTIGQGAEAVVYTVKHVTTGKRYVLKAMRPSIEHPRSNPEAITDLMVTIAHPSIVELVQCFTVKLSGATQLHQTCVVMEYCTRGDLAPKLEQLQRSGIHLSEEWLMFWFIQLLDGIAFMHAKNVVHRDLKPQNVFLAEDYAVKIGDFGVSRVVEDDIQAHTFVGTATYMAPEMFLPRKELAYGTTIDIFALGLIAYELTSPTQRCEEMKILPGWRLVTLVDGSSDTRGIEKEVQDDLRANIPEGVPKQYINLVMRMLSANPAKRITAEGLQNHPYVKKWKEALAGTPPKVEQLEALLYARSFRLYGMGPRINVQKGDMLTEKVDAIVVTQDALFSCSGGLSKALLTVAPSQKQLILTKLDKLKKKRDVPTLAHPVYVKVKREERSKVPFSAVIHVCAPAVTTQGYYRWLVRTFDECLKSAVKHKCRSISFSAIGTGGGGIPASECARAFFDVATNWNEGLNNLELVNLVCIDMATLKGFNDAYVQQILKMEEET